MLDPSSIIDGRQPGASTGTSPAASAGFDPVGYTDAPIITDKERLKTTCFEDSYLHYRWAQRVEEPPSNDFVIAISASGKSSMSRTGKTTLQTQLAEWCDLSEEGFDADKKATLDAGDLAYEVVPEVADKSAVCIDEAQGAAGTVGMDARRGMKTEVIDSLNAILNNGDKQLTIIITAQHLPMLDRRLPPIVDAWVLIRHGPSSPDGPLAIHHAMDVEDYNFNDPKIKTPAHEDIRWPAVSASNPNYKAFERMKQKAKQRYSEDDEEDKKMPKQAQAQIAQDWRNQGFSARWIAENVESITYSYSWIYEHTEDPENNEEEETA
jgi:hypothetical protein